MTSEDPQFRFGDKAKPEYRGASVGRLRLMLQKERKALFESACASFGLALAQTLSVICGPDGAALHPDKLFVGPLIGPISLILFVGADSEKACQKAVEAVAAMHREQKPPAEN